MIDVMTARQPWGCLFRLEPVILPRRLLLSRRRSGPAKEGSMLWTIVAILVILWLLGVLGTVSIPILSGDTVHVLLVIVIIIVVIQVLQRRRL
jgi:hypothetical protein